MHALIIGSLLLSSITAFAQGAEDYLPEGYVVKAKIERPMGKIFDSGAILCAPDLTKTKYNYGYTFKTGAALEVVEFQVTPDTDGPAGLVAIREKHANDQAGALVIKPSSTEMTTSSVKFFGESVDFKMNANFEISLSTVATVEGTLSLEQMKLNIHVVGSFAQDVEMNCEKLK